MQLDWLTWTNPVAIWWVFLLAVSAVNIALLIVLYLCFRRRSFRAGASIFAIEPLVLLCAAYVFGCAFRSVLPRADVQRICLFDTPLSSVLLGRSVATVAEVCFVIQWAIVLRALATVANAETSRNIARAIVPLVMLAEGCSWYAVITTDYLGNVLENSVWTAIFLLIAIALIDLMNRYRGAVHVVLAVAAIGVAGYVAFMCTVDVPMYFVSWRADVAGGREFFGLLSGLHDAAARWVVTRDAARWAGELAWMGLYFSAAVWASLLLAAFGLVKHRLSQYCGAPHGVARGVPLAVAARPSPSGRRNQSLHWR